MPLPVSGVFHEQHVRIRRHPADFRYYGTLRGRAVYSPALTDFIFMVKNTSNMFITGPTVVKSVTAEEVTAEELGGAVTHHTVSGVAHFACENEDDCIVQIKRLLSYLPSNNMEEVPLVETDDSPIVLMKV